MKMRCLSVLAITLLAAPCLAAEAGFALKETPGQCLDVVQGGRLVARYVIAHDQSTPEKRVATNKPFLHVFDAQGKTPITNNGPVGEYPHHRGIFIGWRKIGFEGKSLDLWGMGGGTQIHEKFLAQQADAAKAVVTSLVRWVDKEGKPVLDEERTMTFLPAPKPAYVLVEFASTLKATYGDVLLDGDPEHGGVQYRPDDAMVREKTTYVFPKADAKPHADLDYPWLGETYTLSGKQYSVVMFNHPRNPQGSRFSAYRDYGRFGAYFSLTVKRGESLSVRYRFLVAEGAMLPAPLIQQTYNEFTGRNDAVPTTSTLPAEHKPAKPKSDAKPKKSDQKKKDRK